MTFEPRSHGFGGPLGQPFYGWYRVPPATGSLRRSVAPSVVRQPDCNLTVSRFLNLLVGQGRPLRSKCTCFGDETEP